MALERYTPENPNVLSLEDLAAYVERELQRVSNAFVQEQEEADELHVPPERPQNGGRYLADGANWDPGRGRGWYWYDATIPGFVAFTDETTSAATLEGQAALVASVGMKGVWRPPTSGDLIKSIEVIGSAVTQIDISDLDLNSHNSYYKIVVDALNDTGSSATITMTVEGDHTLTNYRNQVHLSNNTTLAGARTNAPRIATMEASQLGTAVIHMHKTGGYVTAESQNTQGRSTNMSMRSYTWVKTATVTNVTTLRFTASVANSFAIGTTIKVYRG